MTQLVATEGDGILSLIPGTMPLANVLSHLPGIWVILGGCGYSSKLFCLGESVWERLTEEMPLELGFEG